jgi:hypothetical protein
MTFLGLKGSVKNSIDEQSEKSDENDEHPSQHLPEEDVQFDIESEDASVYTSLGYEDKDKAR